MSLRTEWLNHARRRRLADSNRCKASRRNEHVNAPQRYSHVLSDEAELDYAEMLA